MSAMKAYIMDTDRTMHVADVNEPAASENNLIVRVDRASICGTDFRTFMKGNEKIDPPRILGHELAGTVIHSGRLGREKGFFEGDRVTCAPAIGCGKCKPCRMGHTNMCEHLKTIGFQFDGSFAGKVEIPEEALKAGNVIRLEPEISAETACLTEPAACALNAQTYLHIGEGDNVLIYGSGYIGCIHAELALIQGAANVMMVEISEPRIAIARKMLPKVTVINSREKDTFAEVNRITEGRGADVVITALSVPSIHTEAQQIAAKMGRISLFGGLAGESKGFLDSNLIHYKELSVYGSHATTPELMRRVLQYVKEGKLNLEKYVTKIVRLEDIDAGFAAIRDENAMKVIVDPN